MTFAFRGTHTEAAWHENWHRQNVAMSATGVGIAREERPTFVAPDPAFADAPPDFEAVDIDVDDCGTFYVLGRDGNIYQYDPRKESLRRLSCVGREAMTDGEPRALCVTPDTIVVADHVAGDDPHGRLHALSKHLLQTRWVAETAVSPRGLAADGGRVYLADGGSESADAADGVLARVRADGTLNVLLSGLASPRDVAVADGMVAVLVARQVRRWTDAGESAPVPLDGPSSAAFTPTCLEAVGADDLLLGVAADAAVERVLYRYTREEGAEATEEEEWSPDRLRSFGRGCSNLRLHRGKGLYAIDDETGEVVFLTQVTRYARNPATGGYDGQLWRRFDAGEVGMAWHRATTAFDLAGPGTQVRLSFVATDDAGFVVDSGSPEWRPLDHPNPPDAFLPNADGRYLWIKLDIVGNEYESPRVSSFRAYFPRQSYLRYLPGVYQEDEASAAFLERYLSIFESVFVGVEEDVTSVTRYLDPDGIPKTYLSWLGSWLAVASDEAWSVETKAAFIRQAPDLFEKRGTREGLLTMLSLYFDPPSLAASPDAGDEANTSADASEGDESTDDSDDPAEDDPLERVAFLLTDADLDCIDDPETMADYRRLVDCPQCFLVLLRPFVSDEDVRAIDRLVEAETPAHAVGRTVRLQPWLQLGGHAYLGVNSVLPDREFVVDSSQVGTDTVLSEREPAGNLAFQSRLGEDSVIS